MDWLVLSLNCLFPFFFICLPVSILNYFGQLVSCAGSFIDDQTSFSFEASLQKRIMKNHFFKQASKSHHIPLLGIS